MSTFYAPPCSARGASGDWVAARVIARSRERETRGVRGLSMGHEARGGEGCGGWWGHWSGAPLVRRAGASRR
jgi:hypothetical protein